MLPILSRAFAGRRFGRLPTRSASVMALLSLLLVLLTVLSAFYVWRDYREALELGRTRAISAAQTASAHVRWMMEANLQALARVDTALAVESGRMTGEVPDEFAAILATLPAETTLIVVDAAGKTVINSEGNPTGIIIEDRDYFRALRDGRSWVISEMLIGRGTGRKVFTVARRIERNGRFVGAAVAVMPIEVMAQFWTLLELGPASTVGLVREDGWLVARHPAPEQAIDLRDYELFTRTCRSRPAASTTRCRPPTGSSASSATTGSRDCP